jgi:hypothetical protein
MRGPDLCSEPNCEALAVMSSVRFVRPDRRSLYVEMISPTYSTTFACVEEYHKVSKAGAHRFPVLLSSGAEIKWRRNQVAQRSMSLDNTSNTYLIGRDFSKADSARMWQARKESQLPYLSGNRAGEESLDGHPYDDPKCDVHRSLRPQRWHRQREYINPSEILPHAP